MIPYTIKAKLMIEQHTTDALKQAEQILYLAPPIMNDYWMSVIEEIKKQEKTFCSFKRHPEGIIFNK